MYAHPYFFFFFENSTCHSLVICFRAQKMIFLKKKVRFSEKKDIFAYCEVGFKPLKRISEA